MAEIARLKEICEIEELKKETRTTKRALAIVKQLLAHKNNMELYVCGNKV